MQLIIVDGEGQTAVVPLAQDEITIGRGEQNLVRLTEKDVSRRHGRIVRDEGRVYVEDLGSFTGIRVNGERVRGRRALREGDKVRISAYELSLHLAADESLATPRSVPAAPAPPSAPVASAVTPRGNRALLSGGAAVIALLAVAIAFQFGRRHERSDETAREAAASVAPSAAAPAPAAAPASPEVNEAEVRRLLDEGNQKLIAHDVAGALALFDQAIALKPPESLLGGLYRSMGIAFTRQGNLEQGARYYRLYLPLCTNPQEKARLQQLLDDYEARRR